MVTAAVGVTMYRRVKLPVSAAVPALPLSSCQLLLSRKTSAVLMSVPAAPVKVAGVVGAVDHGQAGEHCAAGCGGVGEE